jgi:hypothetical protein
VCFGATVVAVRWVQLSAIHPNEKAIVRHSKAGISSARNASAGHVAQSGIASTPTQVHARGESGRHCRAGGPSDSHKMAELDVMDDASCNAGLARLTRRRECQLRGTKLREALAALGQARQTRIGRGGLRPQGIA